MVSIAVVSKEKHKNVRIKSNPDLGHMKEQNVVSVSIKEMSRATNNFPVVFVRHPLSGDIRLVALLGFTGGENLFYDKKQWKCSYAPLAMLREPLIIGPDESGDNTKLTTCIDMDSKLISETEGLALFNDDGSDTEFYKNQQQLLSEIFDGEVRTHKFIQKMQELDLISGFNVNTQTVSGKVNRYTGLHTINEEKLKGLDKDVVFELHTLNYLPVMYMMLSSAGQFNLLVKLKNLAEPQDMIRNLQLGPVQEEQPV